MEPRFGRLYVAAVLRPLAEQLVAELGVQPGETACDLMCDSGTLGLALGQAVGPRGRTVLVDTDVALLQSAAAEVAGAGCAVATSRAGSRIVPLPDASCDRVGSLGTLGFWDGTSLFGEAERITRSAGTAALLMWDSRAAPIHERVLIDALRDVAGMDSPFLTRCLAAAAPAEPEGWDATQRRDVVRFDGMTHFWAAMVIERPVAAELAGASGAVLREVSARCEQDLQPCTAADGTIRIPVTATVWLRRAGDRRS